MNGAWKRIALGLAGWLLGLPWMALALQTNKVELGNNGAYDGQVQITRDASGQMQLRDATAAASLQQLLSGVTDHGALTGLGDDDHPHYLNGGRHVSAHNAQHTAAFNEGLAISADVNGNEMLGDHLADPMIHLNRNLPESITAGWVFGNGLESRMDVRLSRNGASGDVGIWFEDGASDAQWLWSDAGNRFELNRGLKVDGAQELMGDLKLLGGQLLSGGVTVLDASRNAAVNNLTLGTDGGGARSLRLNSAMAGRYLSFTNQAGAPVMQAFGTGQTLTIQADNYLHLKAGGGAPQYYDAGDLFLWRDIDAGAATRMTLDSASGDLNLVSGGLKTGGTLRLDSSGAASLASASVSGNLSVGAAGAGRFTLNGQPFLNERNLLDNPDFTFWQRNISQPCAAGGNAAGTLTWPVPGTLSLGADRWQVSRGKTDMASTIGRATPPGSLATAQYCLKNEWTAGAACNQYIHQTLPRELVAGLRGKWVTFAVSHYLENGTTGGNVALYKVVGGVPSELNRLSFTSVANAWERLAVAAQVPADAETLLVSVQSNLAAAGPTVAYVANAVLVEGKYVNTTEKAASPALSSVPPLPRPPAEDLAACQRYYEKGALAFSSYAPAAGASSHQCVVAYNTPKGGAAVVTISSLACAGLQTPATSAHDTPAFVAGQSFPQGFKFSVSGTTTGAAALNTSADWVAACAEPL